jgi:glycosyltransferase involved in cell wall biosynthesis
MNEKITVLICVHSNNDFHDELLNRSINSLVNQTYKDFKTLIVLDECWVKTKELVESKNYNLNIKIVEKEKKNGLSSAKNLGLNLIDTEWVSFLDADDLYIETKLEEQILFIENNHVDFLGTHAWNINRNDDYNLFPSCFDNDSFISHEEIKNKIFYENILTHGSMMIRKKCLDELGGYQNVMGSEDWDLWKRAINKGYIFYQIPKRLYIYRLNTSVKR